MAIQLADFVAPQSVTREDLVTLLNEDLAREYQAVISYVSYSQLLKGTAYITIAVKLEQHSKEDLSHALILVGQIDYLGGISATVPKPVKIPVRAEELLRFNLEAVTEKIRHYRKRVRQCEALGEADFAEQIRGILVQELDHQAALADALGEVIPLASTTRTPLNRRSWSNGGITRES